MFTFAHDLALFRSTKMNSTYILNPYPLAETPWKQFLLGFGIFFCVFGGLCVCIVLGNRNWPVSLFLANHQPFKARQIEPILLLYLSSLASTFATCNVITMIANSIQLYEVVDYFEIDNCYYYITWFIFIQLVLGTGSAYLVQVN